MLKIDKEVTASFDIDAQKTFSPFCPEELPVVEGDKIVDELNKNKGFARLHVASRDAHSLNAVWIANAQNPPMSKMEGFADMDIRWPAHAIVGTAGFEFLPGLDSKRYEYQVFKGMVPDQHPYGACYHDFKEHQSTGAIEFLKVNNISTVICGGLATDYCVKTTVLQLLKAGFKVIVNLAACRGIAKETTEQAIAEMTAAGAVMIANAEELAM
ncbi:MAG: isochorismatase family protein [Phascolarctobacterium sp.]|nr:isochorismatase family protein [Phascolarctobacterium sp.]